MQAISQPILRYGIEGEEVIYLQRLLNDIDYACLEVDGIFGEKTEAAVKKFQADHPPLVVDGIVGPQSWKVLMTFTD
jgi:mannosyl-glycoprotein endo-beta-N-acetylglucosaminidase